METCLHVWKILATLLVFQGNSLVERGQCLLGAREDGAKMEQKPNAKACQVQSCVAAINQAWRRQEALIFLLIPPSPLTNPPGKPF